MDTWDPLRGYASPAGGLRPHPRRAQLRRHQLRLAFSRRDRAPLRRIHPRGRRSRRLPRDEQRPRPRRLSRRAGRACSIASVATCRKRSARLLHPTCPGTVFPGLVSKPVCAESFGGSLWNLHRCRDRTCPAPAAGWSLARPTPRFQAQTQSLSRSALSLKPLLLRNFACQGERGFL